jgi:uncharacterized protein (DUF1800 family)
MPASLDNVDPDWAWSSFQPTATRPWNLQLAAHLFRRAGFSASWLALQDAVDNDPERLVDGLLTRPAGAESFENESQALAHAILATGDPKQLSAWWVFVMLRTPQPLQERMTLFWHGHFATSAAKVKDANAMYDQNRLLREHAMSDFSRLVHAVSQDPAMLVYLDSATNRKAHPNENYARELMELFCLGEGNYSERDIQQLARCFTGWEIRRGKFFFNRFQHDNGEKYVLGKTGAFPESEAIDVVLDQPSGPRFIAGKLFRYFVCDEPAPPAALIEPLAVELRQSNWNIANVLRRILCSQLFFSDYAVGRKVRSPVDLLIGLLRSLDGSANTQELGNDLNQLGQGLFFPPNVKGWDGGRTWINSSTLLGRANVIQRVVHDNKTRFGGTNLANYFQQMGASSAKEIVDRLVGLTFAVPPPTDARVQLENIIDTSGAGDSQAIATAIHAMSTLPEFQLC